MVPDILTGVSAGAINAAFLAARQVPFAEKVDRLSEMWAALHIDQVFRVDLRDLASRTLRWGGRLVSGGRSLLPPARSLVDTAPLRAFLERELAAEGGLLAGIPKSLKDFMAFVVTAFAASAPFGLICWSGYQI